MRYLPLLFLISIGCATSEQYPENALYEKILTVRPGHDGCLTNRSCTEYDKNNECLNYKIDDYSLSDDSLRKQLNDFNFICMIGGRLFKVCIDKPGFCRHWYRACGFLGMNKCRQEEYLPISDYSYHLNAQTKCWSFNAYGWIE